MGSRSTGFRRTTSAGYRLPAARSLVQLALSSSPSLSTTQLGKAPPATQAFAQQAAQARKEEQSALRGDQVQQDKIWREFIEAERRGSKYCFLVFLRYQSYYSYPLQTYLEYPILIAQDVFLLLFVLHYSGNMKQALPYIVIFVGGWYFLTLQKWIIDLAMNLCTLISAASKFAQLRCLWQTRDSGQVSALTWSMSAYTCATRIVTTLMTTNDLMVLVRFIIMLVLNIWVTATILRYRKTEKTD